MINRYRLRQHGYLVEGRTLLATSRLNAAQKFGVELSTIPSRSNTSIVLPFADGFNNDQTTSFESLINSPWLQR